MGSCFNTNNIDAGYAKKVHKYHDICVSLKKSSARHNEPRIIDKFAQCKREGTELFDVRTCKCKITDIEKGECICIASNKVPNQEITFLIDQQRDRKMVIGGLDVKTTSQNIRRMKQKVHESDLESSHCQPSTSNTVQLSLQNTDSPASTDTDDKGSDYESVADVTFEKKTPNWRCLALACDRTKVSDRSAAMIATAVLEDAGIIEKDPMAVLDKNKIRRQHSRTRKDLQKTQ